MLQNKINLFLIARDNYFQGISITSKLIGKDFEMFCGFP